MDIASVAGSVEAIKALIGITKVAVESAVDQKIKAAIYEVQCGLYELQGEALDERAIRSELQDQISKLKRELEIIQDERAKLEAYELQPLEDGAFVYQSKSEAGHKVAHHACPSCYQDGKIGILQCRASMNGQTHWHCSKCQFTLNTGNARALRSIHAPVGGY
jgi:predicted RNA-binding Zn-ribbon protein involved in translation (DUF1610 family)